MKKDLLEIGYKVVKHLRIDLNLKNIEKKVKKYDLYMKLIVICKKIYIYILKNKKITSLHINIFINK